MSRYSDRSAEALILASILMAIEPNKRSMEKMLQRRLTWPRFWRLKKRYHERVRRIVEKEVDFLRKRGFEVDLSEFEKWRLESSSAG